MANLIDFRRPRLPLVIWILIIILAIQLITTFVYGVQFHLSISRMEKAEFIGDQASRLVFRFGIILYTIYAIWHRKNAGYALILLKLGSSIYGYILNNIVGVDVLVNSLALSESASFQAGSIVGHHISNLFKFFLLLYLLTSKTVHAYFNLKSIPKDV